MIDPLKQAADASNMMQQKLLIAKLETLTNEELIEICLVSQLTIACLASVVKPDFISTNIHLRAVNTIVEHMMKENFNVSEERLKKVSAILNSVQQKIDSMGGNN